MSIGSRIRARRKELGWSSQKLSDESRVAKEQISRYETGGVTPRPETLARLARALGVPAQQLMFGDGDEPEWEAGESDEPPEAEETRLEPEAEHQVTAFLEFLETDLGQRLQQGQVLGAEADAKILEDLGGIRWGGIEPTVARYISLAHEEVARRVGKGVAERPKVEVEVGANKRKLPNRGKSKR